MRSGRARPTTCRSTANCFARGIDRPDRRSKRADRMVCSPARHSVKEKRLSKRNSAVTSCTLVRQLTVLMSIIHHAAPHESKPHISRFDLFPAFSRISLSSFGGAIFWTRRELVERRGWLDDSAFVDAYTLGQLLPGPNVLNLDRNRRSSLSRLDRRCRWSSRFPRLALSRGRSAIRRRFSRRHSRPGLVTIADSFRQPPSVHSPQARGRPASA